MINLDNVDICYKATREVLEYFFDDSKEIAGILKLDGKLSPASYAIFALLAKEQNFKSKQGFLKLASQNFCQKAMTIFPKIFKLDQPQLKTQLDEIMRYARGFVDGLGTGFVSNGEKRVNYSIVDRQKLVALLKRRYSAESIEKYQEKIRKQYTQSDYGKALGDFYDEHLGDRKVKNSVLYSKQAQYAMLEIEERESLALDIENRYSVNEMDNLVIDAKAYSYKGVLLAPRVVNMHGNNPALFHAGRVMPTEEYVFCEQAIAKNGPKFVIKECT